jgi:peptide/nickel transport system permease protein
MSDMSPESRHDEIRREVTMAEQGMHEIESPLPEALEDVGDQYGMEAKSRGQWASAMRRFVRQPRAMIGVAVFFGIMITSLVYTLVLPHEYFTLSANISQPPSLGHPFGTGPIGIDMFAQVMKGTLNDVEIALMVAVISVAVGVLIGALAGFYGGKVDALLMRFVDIVLIIPVLVVLILLSHHFAGTSNNALTLALIIGAFSWTYIARLVRADFLSLREREFVEASRALGANDRRLILRHLMPNALGPVIVNATITVAGAIGLEATLSYLGLGVQSPNVSLGGLIYSGQDAATTFWWLFVYPCAMLIVLILAVFFIGDGLQIALNPRTRRARA